MVKQGRIISSALLVSGGVLTTLFGLRQLNFGQESVAYATKSPVVENPIASYALQFQFIPTTESNFTREQERLTFDLPYKTKIEYTDRLYLGEEEVVQAGVNGQRIEVYEVDYWNGEEYQRSLASAEEVPPVDKIIQRGTKKQVRNLNTPEGTVSYYQVIRMWAMSYDGNCLGCSGRTYLGTPVKYGVCAVDPSVIPLGSWVYVPDYGKCRAEDIGGAIVGNMIDLGFADVNQGWWSSRYVDVYLLEE